MPIRITFMFRKNIHPRKKITIKFKPIGATSGMPMGCGCRRIPRALRACGNELKKRGEKQLCPVWDVWQKQNSAEKNGTLSPLNVSMPAMPMHTQTSPKKSLEKRRQIFGMRKWTKMRKPIFLDKAQTLKCVIYSRNHHLWGFISKSSELKKSEKMDVTCTQRGQIGTKRRGFLVKKRISDIGIQEANLDKN